MPYYAEVIKTVTTPGQAPVVTTVYDHFLPDSIDCDGAKVIVEQHIQAGSTFRPTGRTIDNHETFDPDCSGGGGDTGDVVVTAEGNENFSAGPPGGGDTGNGPGPWRLNP